MHVQIKRRGKIDMFVLVGRDIGSNKTRDVAAASDPALLNRIATRAGWRIVKVWP